MHAASCSVIALGGALNPASELALAASEPCQGLLHLAPISHGMHIRSQNRQLLTHKAGDAAALGGLRPLPQLIRSLQLLRCVVSVLLLPCINFDCQASQQHLHPAPLLGMHTRKRCCPA